jgi:hypothetical protein
MNSDIVVSFHDKLAAKCCLEFNDEIDRQLQCKICDVELHFWVLQEVPYKGEIQLLDVGGESYIYIQQISTKNVEFYSI